MTRKDLTTAQAFLLDLLEKNGFYWTIPPEYLRAAFPKMDSEEIDYLSRRPKRVWEREPFWSLEDEEPPLGEDW